MRLSPALFLRSWIAKLHPPVVTTPQENKQLLSMLESSFQRKLDDAHPPIRHPRAPAAKQISDSSQPIDNTAAKAAVNHLRSLLQHPLLAETSTRHKSAQCAATTAAAMMDQAMLQGRADLDMIGKCLDLYRPTLKRGSPAIEEDSRLGKRISAWFMSSDSASKDQFLCSIDLLRNAVPVMYADGQEEVVWDWLRLLYSRESPEGGGSGRDHPLPWVIQECHLTFFMIKEALRRSRLDAAVLQFVQACGYMQRTGRLSSEARLSLPWQSATNAVTMALLRRRHRHGLSVRLFDDLLEHRAFWADNDFLAFELISTYHPTQPSTRSLESAVNQPIGQVEAQIQMKNISKPAKKTVLIALLDSARLMGKQDRISAREAQHLLDLIERKFQLGVNLDNNETAQKRFQSVQRLISPQEFSLGPAGIT